MLGDAPAPRTATRRACTCTVLARAPDTTRLLGRIAATIFCRPTLRPLKADTLHTMATRASGTPRNATSTHSQLVYACDPVTEAIAETVSDSAAIWRTSEEIVLIGGTDPVKHPFPMMAWVCQTAFLIGRPAQRPRGGASFQSEYPRRACSAVVTAFRYRELSARDTGVPRLTSAACVLRHPSSSLVALEKS